MFAILVNIYNFKLSKITVKTVKNDNAGVKLIKNDKYPRKTQISFKEISFTRQKTGDYGEIEYF
ncbi:MAG: hypothetical protein Kow0079_15560 [Vicingaceae bacterium]